MYLHACREVKARAGDALDERSALCLFLILERARGDASLWAPYIQFLPESYDDPYYWDTSCLALLKGTRLARAVEGYRPHLAALTGWMAELRNAIKR